MASSTVGWLLDCTLPLVSAFCGRQISYFLKNIFSNINIEDFWTPFIVVTTDITDECKRCHTTGPASTYIQASMTLIGYLPPVCDPVDDHLLADGGYTDLVPGITEYFIFFYLKSIEYIANDKETVFDLPCLFVSKLVEKKLPTPSIKIFFS